MERKRGGYSAISPKNAFLCTNNNKEVYYDLIFYVNLLIYLSISIFN